MYVVHVYELSRCVYIESNNDDYQQVTIDILLLIFSLGLKWCISHYDECQIGPLTPNRPKTRQAHPHDAPNLDVLGSNPSTREADHQV